MIVLVCLEAPQPGRGAKAAEALARRLVGVAQTVAISAGGTANSEAIAWALGRRSFQRIIHLDAPSLDKTDFMTLGTVLAEVARKVEANVVIAGEHSDVEGQGLVPAALAHQLHAPLLSRVQDVRLPSPDSRQLEITVPAGGRLCTLECPFPVVLTTTAAFESEAVAPEVPSAASVVETITLAQLALDSSRLVPRPELLGSRLPLPASKTRHMTSDEAARILLRRQ